MYEKPSWKPLALAGVLAALTGISSIAAASARPPADALRMALLVAHMNYDQAEADPFSDKPAALPKGTAFKIELKPHQKSDLAEGNSATWSYADGHLLLQAIIEPPPANMITDPPKMLIADWRTSHIGSYVGENAFGAAAKVRVIYVAVDAIAPTAAPKADPNPGVDNPSLGADPWFQSYWVSVPLSGPDARKLSQRARLVIEGTSDLLPNGRAIDCGKDERGATLDDPREENTVYCWAAVSLDRVAWVDSAEGHVLKEWRR